MPTGCDQGACASKYMYSAVRLIGTATAAARQTERQNAHAPGCSRLPMVRNPASMQCTRAHHQLKTPEWGAHECTGQHHALRKGATKDANRTQRRQRGLQAGW